MRAFGIMAIALDPIVKSPVEPGALVRHVSRPNWGFGKVIRVEGEDVLVFFKSMSDGRPESSVVTIRLRAPLLEVVTGIEDTDLANLPPYADGQFRRHPTTLTLKRAKELFLRAFPLGFGDPAYLAPRGTGEREYKLAAHRRYITETANGLSQLAEDGLGSDIRAALERISRSPNVKELESLNLLHPQWEAPRFFEALEDTSFARLYLKASCAFIAAPHPDNFAALTSALEQLPGSNPNSRVGKWPFCTWLPFIADPTRHMLIRPSIAIGFASILPFEIRYRPELNYETYRLVILMSESLRARVIDTELNLNKRQLDMIDMQSFMWVVQRHFEPNALEQPDTT